MISRPERTVADRVGAFPSIQTCIYESGFSMEHFTQYQFNNVSERLPPPPLQITRVLVPRDLIHYHKYLAWLYWLALQKYCTISGLDLPFITLDWRSRICCDWNSPGAQGLFCVELDLLPVSARVHSGSSDLLSQSQDEHLGDIWGISALCVIDCFNCWSFHVVPVMSWQLVHPKVTLGLNPHPTTSWRGNTIEVDGWKDG